MGFPNYAQPGLRIQIVAERTWRGDKTSKKSLCQTICGSRHTDGAFKFLFFNDLWNVPLVVFLIFKNMLGSQSPICSVASASGVTQIGADDE
jgi:hypothetical protein